MYLGCKSESEGNGGLSEILTPRRWGATAPLPYNLPPKVVMVVEFILHRRHMKMVWAIYSGTSFNNMKQGESMVPFLIDKT